ncbi:MAG: hypothetical protein R2874_03025 [Desulfobacterales bacterium]
MKKPFAITIFLILTVCIFSHPTNFSAWTAEPEKPTVKLPPPAIENGKPLMQVLKRPAEVPEFKNEKLTMQVMSDLLAAWASNRPDTGKRTAPSARDRREIDVYGSRRRFVSHDSENHALIVVAGRYPGLYR